MYNEKIQNIRNNGGIENVSNSILEGIYKVIDEVSIDSQQKGYDKGVYETFQFMKENYPEVMELLYKEVAKKDIISNFEQLSKEQVSMPSDIQKFVDDNFFELI